MEYSEIKAFLNDTPQYGETTGVERAGKLLELLGNPDKNLKIIHIAGTNGKGSVCSYIDDILKKSLEIFEEVYNGEKLRLIGITVSNLVDLNIRQLTFFKS